jgi:hypothetical protein
MVILRAFLALAGGLSLIALLSIVFQAALRRLVPEWARQEGRPTAGAAFVQTGGALLTAVAGGCFTAWTASASPLAYVLVLGIIVLAVGALSALQARGRQPAWFQLAQVVIAPLGVLAGGLIYLRLEGIL